MPTYEYACKDCGGHLEVVQSFTDDALTECPTCQGQLRKLFGSVGISFKGSGFYKNDSRSKSKSSSTSTTETSSTSESSSDSPVKTETKPEPKKETKTETPAASSGSSEKAAG